MDALSPNQGAATIGATSVKQFNEVAATLFRDVGYIKNTSVGGQVISIGDGINAVNGSGVTLNPQEVWVDAYDGYHNPTQNAIRLIASAAGATVAFYEKLLPLSARKPRC